MQTIIDGDLFFFGLSIINAGVNEPVGFIDFPFGAFFPLNLVGLNFPLESLNPLAIRKF